MINGILAGLTWGLDTVILGIALSQAPFLSTPQAIALAPFISTFLHDLCSSVWMIIYMTFKRQIKATIKAFRTRSGKFIILAALLGGPIGMTGYVNAINYIGPAYTATISALFPAVGAGLSYIFLKEKMKKYQFLGLITSIAGVIALGYQPGGLVKNFVLGFLCALICVFGWSAEAVICSYGMRGDEVSSEQALQLRQLTSAITYGIVLLPVMKAWPVTISIAGKSTMLVIIISALFGTASYVFYYKAIYKIGASKSMALNITYAAWAIVFGFILLHTVPSAKDIICAIIIMAGSIIAATDINEYKTDKSKQ